MVGISLLFPCFYDIYVYTIPHIILLSYLGETKLEMIDLLGILIPVSDDLDLTREE
jgi:hypothetical protein